MNRKELRKKIKATGAGIVNQYKIHYRQKDWQQFVKKNIKEDRLTDKQKAEVIAFWKPYYKKITPDFFEWYVESGSEFDVRFLPSDFYYSYIDPYFNDWNTAITFDNKCMYREYFYDVKQPETVAMRVNGIWFTGNQTVISKGELKDLLESEDEMFLKVATESDGGHGVYYFTRETAAQIGTKINSIESDIIIQRPIRQHAILADINSSSVNTIRVTSLLSDSGVKIYSHILRMGIKGSKVDNESSGGLTCGITDDGRLYPTAHNKNGVIFEEHPDSHIKFDGYQITGLNEVKELVKKLHCRLPHFRLISWDFTIDENGAPVLIEANLKYGGLECQQLNTGPLFGNDTEKILKEVFGK